MKTLMIVATLCGVGCVSEQPLEEASQGAAGSVGVVTEALDSQCYGLANYARHWLDDNTYGSLKCGESSTAETWHCYTNPPNITYDVRLRFAMFGNGNCDSLLYGVKQSQSGCWQFQCKQNGAAASCRKVSC